LIVVYFLWRIQKSNKGNAKGKEPNPALRLSDQWISDAQKNLEDLVKRSEIPLGTAQNELLELRLEAGRLPTGVKSLQLIRETLSGPFQTRPLEKRLLEIAGIYLENNFYRIGDLTRITLITTHGDIACLEVQGKEDSLTEKEMKDALGAINQSMIENRSSVGVLYFSQEKAYQDFLLNEMWVTGLKAQKLLAVDLKGLTAILVSLRFYQDSDKVIQVFEQGIKAAQALTGQSDKMNQALSRLNSHTVRILKSLDGNMPEDLGDSIEVKYP
jgi:hypothetical protein